MYSSHHLIPYSVLGLALSLSLGGCSTQQGLADPPSHVKAGDDAEAQCSLPRYSDTPASYTNILAQLTQFRIYGESTLSQIDEKEIQTELDHGRPVIAVYLNSLEEHYLVITDVDTRPKSHLYSVTDPILPEANDWITYKDLLKDPDGKGRWTFSIHNLTKH